MRRTLSMVVGLGLMCGCGTGQLFFAPTDLAAEAGGTSTGGQPAGTTSGGTTGGNGITVVTLAGNGIFGDQDGSGGRNGTAEFGWPMGLAVDPAGNVFVPDQQYSNIRKIDGQGNVSTWAGNGQGDQDGSGGANGTAQFSAPKALALGPSDDLFVADTINNVVREIYPTGNVTTLPINESDGIPFSNPGAIAVDANGTIYLADTYNQRICAIAITGQVVTVAGTGVAGYADGIGSQAQFDNPYGLAVDSQGNVYVGDSENNVIRRIDGSSGYVTTVAGSGIPGWADGSASQAEFDLPSGLAVDGRGDILVADCNNNRIRNIDPSGNVTTVAGNGAAGDLDGSGGPNGPAEFNHPFGVAVDTAGNIYIGGNDDYRVRKITLPH